MKYTCVRELIIVVKQFKVDKQVNIFVERVIELCKDKDDKFIKEILFLLDSYELSRYFEICSVCNKLHAKSLVYSVVDKQGFNICKYCLDNTTEYHMCHDCGKVFSETTFAEVHSPNGSVISMELCDDCYGRNYRTCDDCGKLFIYDDVHEYNDDYFCNNCYQSNYKVIRNHDFKPVPLFYGSGSTYFGFELEVENALSDERSEKELNNIADTLNNDIFYSKWDGSLNNGFEVVSHPLSMDWIHSNKDEIQKMTSTLHDAGFKSHNANTCGLHVHISRSAFGSGLKQDINILKILLLFEKFEDQLIVFSRRNYQAMQKWAAISKGSLQEKKQHSNNSRYRAINLKNSSTVEFRIFRGTLKFETILASIELCDHMVKVCCNSGLDYIQSLTWKSFIKGIPFEYEYLREYIGIKFPKRTKKEEAETPCV